MLRLVEAEEPSLAALVIEGNDPVGKDEMGVRQVGPRRGGTAAIGLELIAEITDPAADKRQIEALRRWDPPLIRPAFQGVEDRLLRDRAAELALAHHLVPGHVIRDLLGQGTSGITHE